MLLGFATPKISRWVAGLVDPGESQIADPLLLESRVMEQLPNIPCTTTQCFLRGTIRNDNRERCQSLYCASAMIANILQIYSALYKEVLVGWALGPMDISSFVGVLPSRNGASFDGRNTSSSKAPMLIKRADSLLKKYC